MVIQSWHKHFQGLLNTDVQKDVIWIAMEVMEKGRLGDLEKVFFIAWGMWYRTNQQIFEHKTIQPNMAIDKTLSIATEYKEVRDVRHPRKTQCSCALKLNVDGAIFEDQEKVGVAMLLRNDRGLVLFSASKMENGVIIDPMEVELLAILRGLQLCIRMGILELVIESDSLMLVEELNNTSESRLARGNLVHEVKKLIKRIPRYSVQHKGRMANEAAHNLARYAKHLEDLIVW
ncbi:uncharacterized protein LOC122282170 [Carya illinoinensis]|uniref:uncharacterized protein LOC122282170 n=1 Tax=Carya illinoinensis TaxID=32201 RepID=UPI001C71B230|nr:uncharacterized protein LOC122282170 [Carya illinoinensis]